jgi:phospholipid-binding lipoprotein MlaA
MSRMSHRAVRYIRHCIQTLALAATVSGCATTAADHPQDPFEGFNRAMFSFNDGLDQAVLKPVATVYAEALPSFVQTAVGNFFGNIGDVWTAVNNLLQGKLENGLSDVMRVAVNTTFGLVGLADIGSELGMHKHQEDFGQTLGTWGIASGPYVVLPFLGSTTLRDTAALPADFAGDLWTYKRPVYVRNVGSAVRVVDQRAAVLDASNLLEDAALDRYEFVRDAYLQRRSNRINDGNDPAPKRDEQPSNGDSPRPKADDKSSWNQVPHWLGGSNARTQLSELKLRVEVQLSSLNIDVVDGDRVLGLSLPRLQKSVVSSYDIWAFEPALYSGFMPRYAAND